MKRVAGQRLCVALGLGENVLRTEREFLCFDDAEDLAVRAEGVVGRAVVGRVFLDRAAIDFASGVVGSKGTMGQPAFLSRVSMSFLRVSHSEFWGEALGMAGETPTFAKYQ